MLGGNSGTVQKFATEIYYDWLFVLMDTDMYLIPKTEIKDIKNCITLGEKYNKFKIGSAAGVGVPQ